MKEITALVSRNRKLFFKDKGMLFSSMITPVILIVLYATFLANVYKDSFVSATKDMIDLPDKIIDGTVAAQLAAALLAVSCVTVTFCVNLTMVQDRASGARKDFDVSPVSKTKIYIGYFLSTVLNSLMVNGTALALCLFYILKMGWYMSASDVIFVILDMILLVLFGSTLSSIVSYPLKTQGQLSAVGTMCAVHTCRYLILVQGCRKHCPTFRVHTELPWLRTTCSMECIKRWQTQGFRQKRSQS